MSAEQRVAGNISASPDAEKHPDPQQLRQFAADQLELHERAPMLEHLAVCGLCRAFLVLVAPEEGPPSTASRAIGVVTFRARLLALVKWITCHGIKVDRVACPGLIQRFDP